MFMKVLKLVKGLPLITFREKHTEQPGASIRVCANNGGKICEKETLPSLRVVLATIDFYMCIFVIL